MIIKKNLIEAGKYMNIRGKSYTLKHMEILKISQSYTCMVDQEKVVMIFISSIGTFKRFSICNYDRSKRCLSLRRNY